jgi:hypothetical protein
MALDLKIVDVTLVVDTAIYAATDLLSATQQIPSAVFDKNSPAMLQSLVAIDESDNAGTSFDVYLLRANQSFGTFNNAPTLSDAGARDVLAKVSVITTDFKDLGGVKIAFYGNLGIPVLPETDTTNLYVATVLTAGTPTFATASDVKLRLGFTT